MWDEVSYEYRGPKIQAERKPLVIVKKTLDAKGSTGRDLARAEPSHGQSSHAESEYGWFFHRYNSERQFKVDDPSEAESLREALDAGLDPNILLQPEDIINPFRDGGGFSHLFPIGVRNAWPHWNTPLHRALFNHDYESACLLLERGADINVRNSLGNTAIHEAIQSFREWDKNIPFLISRGADLDAATVGRTVLDHTDKRTRQISSQGGLTPLHMTFMTGSTSNMITLIKAGASINMPSAHGWSIFDLVLLDQQWPMLTALFACGARPSMPQTPRDSFDDMPENISQLAKRLLCETSTRGVFPPLECLPIYHYILSMKPCQDTLISAQSNSCLIKNLVHTFIDILRNLALRPLLPALNSFCSRCLEFQQPTELSCRDNNGASYSPLKADIRSLRASARTGCAMCGMFVDALDKDFSQFTAHDPLVLTVHRETFGRITKLKLKVLSPGKQSLNNENDIEIHDIQGTGSSNALNTARYWLQTCKSCPQHVSCQEAMSSETPVLPTRVIDVGDETSHPFLFEPQGLRASYCALSYCWGKTRTIKTTKSTITKHKNSIRLHKLPATIRDAVLVTRSLGMRYLWVDALCIIQDDANDWAQEAARMQFVYANADLTISSLVSSNSADGLFRPRRVRWPKPVPVPALRVEKLARRQDAGQAKSPTMFALVPTWLGIEAPRRGTVHSRGWTLQEQMLSHRILYFGDGMLHWECLSLYATEATPIKYMGCHAKEMPLEVLGPSHTTWQARQQRLALRGLSLDPSPESELGTVVGTESASQPGSASRRRIFRLWQELLTEYTTYRQLTNSSDRLQAFLGISSFIAPQLGCTFVSGVWDGDWFAESLCWDVHVPTHYYEDSDSEKPGYLPKYMPVPKVRTSASPSWSWVSVIGAPISYRLIQHPDKDKASLIQSLSFNNIQALTPKSHMARSIELRGTVGRVDKTPHGLPMEDRWITDILFDCVNEITQSSGPRSRKILQMIKGVIKGKTYQKEHDKPSDPVIWYLDILGQGQSGRSTSHRYPDWQFGMASAPQSKIQLLLIKVTTMSNGQNLFKRIGIRTVKANWGRYVRDQGGEYKHFAGPDPDEKEMVLTII
ncbi:heterokaryon incompatibility [Fusarium albosuccineum]|uniref:Heterokaryon incompatibility n=1 Tax=Fusarium albosuccineum TaxID=1237068 RepID=A0A8H4P8I0_9HYPO|nr:heterokaryon incompatibility [Fusarium albosuccineum]